MNVALAWYQRAEAFVIASPWFIVFFPIFHELACVPPFITISSTSVRCATFVFQFGGIYKMEMFCHTGCLTNLWAMMVVAKCWPRFTVTLASRKLAMRNRRWARTKGPICSSNWNYGCLLVSFFLGGLNCLHSDDSIWNRKLSWLMRRGGITVTGCVEIYGNWPAIFRVVEDLSFW